MKNPYFELHKEFRAGGASILMSSGQACVAYGIATFSKDGDWVIEETDETCGIVLGILNKKGASYRLGAPLDTRWLSKDLTSHFEYFLENGYRMRVDICSRPPRVDDLKRMWDSSIRIAEIDVVDIEDLMSLKQTQRLRDYNIIGALAEVAGFEQNLPDIALRFLQDFSLLKKAVDRWPRHAEKCDRGAIQAILSGKPRSEVVAALAIEQDEMIQKDEKRIDAIRQGSLRYQREFAASKKMWSIRNASLLEQHEVLVTSALESGL